MKFLKLLTLLAILCPGLALAQNGGGPNGGGGGGGGGTPGGSPTQIQYNASGSFGGIAGTGWDGTKITVPYAYGADGLMSSSLLTSANHVTVGYATQASVGFLTGLQATNQSFAAFVGRNTNAAGYTVFTLANDSYQLGSLLSVPNSATCCDLNTYHQFNIILNGTSAPANQYNALPAGEAVMMGPSGQGVPMCLGTFAHCITIWDGDNGAIKHFPSSGQTAPSFWTRSLNGTVGLTDGSAIRADGSTSTDASYGIDINAGTTANDWALRVNNDNGPSAAATYFLVRGDGKIFSVSPNRLSYGNYDMRAGSGAGISVTATGFSTDPVSVNIGVNVSGPIVCARVNPFTATSNATNLSIDLSGPALPGHGEGMALVIDNGTTKQGTWYYDGTHLFFAVGTVPADSTGNFTATGTKGIPGTVGADYCWGAN